MDQEYPQERLQEMLDEDRVAIIDRLGPQRRIGVLLIRAREEPNELVTRSFDEAKEHIDKLSTAIAEGVVFEQAVSLHSEDATSQAQEGDIGWHHRISKDIPEPVLETAFGLPIAGVSGPVRSELGWFLVKVHGAKPPMTDEELRREMRTEIIEKETERILDEAQIVMVK